MASRPAPALVLRDGDHEVLEGRLPSRSVSAGLTQRARIVLLADEGVGTARSRNESARRRPRGSSGASDTTTVVVRGSRTCGSRTRDEEKTEDEYFARLIELGL